MLAILDLLRTLIGVACGARRFCHFPEQRGTGKLRRKHTSKLSNRTRQVAEETNARVLLFALPGIALTGAPPLRLSKGILFCPTYSLLRKGLLIRAVRLTWRFIITLTSFVPSVQRPEETQTCGPVIKSTNPPPRTSIRKSMKDR